MTIRDTVNSVVKRLRDSTNLDEKVNQFVQPMVQRFTQQPQQTTQQVMDFARRPLQTAASTVFQAPQIQQPLQQGVQRVSNDIKNDPGQFWIGRGYASIAPEAKVVFKPIVGDQAAEDIGFGLQGAAKLNPLSWTNYGLDKKGTQIQQANAPKTQRQQVAQDVGQAAYGTLLTAPIGAGGSAAKAALNIGSRAIQGAALGAGMTAAGTLATQRRLPTKQELGQGVLGGVENSWKLAITNAVTDKLLGAVGLPNLQSANLDKAWKVASAAKDSGLQASGDLVKNAVMSTLLRGLSEVPAENTLFTALDKLNGKEKETFVDAFVRNLPGNILGNMIFAGGNAALQGGEILTRDQRRAAGEAALRAFEAVKRGYQDIQETDAANYKAMTGRDLPPGASAGFIAGGKATGFADAQQNDKTFTGVDQKQKFEVSDIGAKLLNPMDAQQAPDGTYRLGDILDHKELYKQYPDLADTRIKLSSAKTNLDAGGAYSPDTNTIEVAVSGSSDNTKRALLHEIQHAIQTKEGFATGGSPYNFVAEPETQARLKTLQSQIEAMKNQPGFANTSEYKALANEYNALAIGGDAERMKQYRRLAGEVESRGVESRMGLSQDQIDAVRLQGKNDPGAMYDVAPDDQVVTFGGNKVNNEPSPLRPGQDPISDRTYNNQDITARERFNIPLLQKLSGGGSDRDVYDLGDGRVLKIAKTARGLAQNDVEGEPYAPVPQLIERGKNYVVVEKVNPPDAQTKKMVSELKKLNIWELNNDRSPNHYDEVNKAIEILDKYGVDGNSVGNYNMMWGDLSSIRNWGTDAQGTPVHLDAGTFNSRLIDEFKGVKNLDNPEFRDVYNQSRTAKKAFGDTDPNTMYKIPMTGETNVNDQPFNEQKFIQELDQKNQANKTPLENKLQQETGRDIRMGLGNDPSQALSPEDIKLKASQSYQYDPEMTGKDGMFQDFRAMLNRFIGNRDAAKTTGTQIAQQFADIPQDQAWDVIKYLENPEKYADASPEVKQWAQGLSQNYDQLYKFASDNGVDMGFIENYNPHRWKQPPGEVQQRFLSARGNFPNAKDRIFPTFEEGIAIGLTPEYDHPAQMLERYAIDLNRAVNARQFMQELQDKGVIVTGAVARENPGFVRITAPGFTKQSELVMTGNGGVKEVMGDWYAPKEVAKLINTAFTPQDEIGLFKNTAKLSKGIQEITLSGGAPGTPINAFGIANLQKELLSGNIVSPIQAFARSMSRDATNNYFTENADIIKLMQQENVDPRAGYSVDQMIDRGTVKNALGSSAGEAWGKLMEDGTFKRFMPMLSIDTFKNVYNQALDGGASQEEAQSVAARAVKQWTGAITTDQMALRDPNMRNLASTFFFAPTFRESMVNFWVNNVKALAHPLALENQKNVRFMIGAAATYAMMDLANRHFQGHSMMENPEGKQDKLLIPLSNGKTIGVPYLSSIATVPRGIARGIGYLASGDVSKAAADAYQTFASQAIKAPGDIALNQDYFGNPIYEENAPMGQKFAQMGQYTVKNLMHPWLREGLNAAEANLPLNDQTKKNLGIKTEPVPLYQTISQATEMPFRFYKTQSLETAPFWNRYFDLKKKSEYYDELSYKDKTAALDYLNKNRADLVEFKRMRGLVGATNGGQDPEALKNYMGNGNVVFAADGTQPTVSNTEQNREFIKERLKLGDKVSPDELRVAYLGSALDMPSSNRYEQGMKSKTLYGKISDIDSNETLSQDQKDALYSNIAQELGITQSDMDYYRVARQDNDLKTMHVYDQVQQGNLDHNGLVQYLIQGRRKVNGEVIAADGVLKNLYDDGMLSKGEYNTIRAIKQNANGSLSRSGGSGRKSVKFNAPDAPKISSGKVKITIAKPKLDAAIQKVRIAKTVKPTKYQLPTRKTGAILALATKR